MLPPPPPPFRRFFHIERAAVGSTDDTLTALGEHVSFERSDSIVAGSSIPSRYVSVYFFPTLDPADACSDMLHYGRLEEGDGTVVVSPGFPEAAH